MRLKIKKTEKRGPKLELEGPSGSVGLSLLLNTQVKSSPRTRVARDGKYYLSDPVRGQGGQVLERPLLTRTYKSLLRKDKRKSPIFVDGRSVSSITWSILMCGM